MLTSWLWIHSPDRHRGVDVVCSNRSLGLESTSSVVNERLLFPQTGPPAQKRKDHTDDRREQLRRGSEDRHPLVCSSIDRRRRRFLLIHSSLSGIIHSTTELFWNLRLLFVRVEPVHRAWKPKEVHWGEEESLKGPRISTMASGVEWRRKASEDRNV